MKRFSFLFAVICLLSMSFWTFADKATVRVAEGTIDRNFCNANVSIKGDIDKDGKVLESDAILALAIAVDLIESTDAQIAVGDMNNDGKIKSNDAILILRKAVGTDIPPPPEWPDPHFLVDKTIHVEYSGGTCWKREIGKNLTNRGKPGNIFVNIVLEKTEKSYSEVFYMDYDETVKVWVPVSCRGVGNLRWTARPALDSDTSDGVISVERYGYCTADFAVDHTNGLAPLTVQFSDESITNIGHITDWFWDFGDGTTSPEQNPTHTYNNPGTYTVNLTVTADKRSDTETKEDFITAHKLAIQVSAPEIFADPGSKITVTINVDDATGIAGGDIVLEYNPDVLVLKEARTTELTKNLILIANTAVPGRVVLGMAGISALKEGNGALLAGVDFEIKANVTGESLLSLSDVAMYGEVGNNLPVEASNGKIIVQKDETPNKEYSRWDLTKDGIVNFLDLVLVGKNFGEYGDDIEGDVNSDGEVNIFDLVLVGSHFEEEIAAPSIQSTSLLQQIYDILKRLPDPNPNLKLALKELEKLLAPSETKLLQNYPNPFNPDTWIPYQLASDTPVTINIYNTQGQLIRTLHLGTKKAGIYLTKEKAAYWDGKDNFGRSVASGVYFYQMKAGDFSATRKLMILK